MQAIPLPGGAAGAQASFMQCKAAGCIVGSANEVRDQLMQVLRGMCHHYESACIKEYAFQVRHTHTHTI